MNTLQKLWLLLSEIKAELVDPYSELVDPGTI